MLIKKNRLLLAGILFFGMMIFSQCSSSRKYEKLDKNDVEQLVNQHAFTFIAQNMQPMRGRQRTLSEYYDIKIKPDSVISFLPYFGRAFIAPIDPSKGGLQFNSTQFDYKVTSSKPDEWNVTIVPHDVSEVHQISFLIFGNGDATLDVNSAHRDPISFSGYLQKND